MFLRIVFVSLILIIPFGIWFAPGVFGDFIGFLFLISPLWLPPLLLVLLIPLWLTYIRSQFGLHVPYTVLELKPGEKTTNPARAMELVFYSLHRHDTIPWYKEFLLGAFRLPWSFEITAHDGTVRFFMRIPRSHRQAIEMRLRTEYRDIDIDEVRDYARVTDFNASSMKLAVREYALSKPDPYPIKTYEAMGTAPDPLHALLGQLTRIGDGEHFYISYIVRPHQRERRVPWEPATDTLHTEAQEAIGDLLGPGGDVRTANEATQRVIKAIEDALKKPSFDCGIRALYFADRVSFNDERVQLLDELFKDFSDPNLNTLIMNDPKQSLSWPLSDIYGAIPSLYESYIHNLYRRRAFFAPPYKGTSFVLDSAELATLFYLPQVTRTSVLARGKGRRLEPPENLPT